MNRIVRNIGRIVAANLIPSLAYPVVIGPLKGLKFILGSISGPGKGASVYFNLVEQNQTKEFLNYLKKDSIIFDIGANVGYYTLLASKKIDNSGLVFAFEPAVRNLSFLYRHIQLNKVKNVIVLPFACSNTNSLEVFSFDKDSALGHLENNYITQSINPLSSTIVNTTTVDNFVEKIGVIPNIIKIDVEGAELQVLRGAKETLAQQKVTIFLSIHTDQLKIDCLNFLKELGYETKLIDEKERPSVEYLCY